MGARAPQIHWEDIVTFRVVAQQGSFTRAAEKMYVAVSTVSTRIKRLERMHHTVLLHRTTSRVELSEQGAILLAAVDDMMALYDVALSDLESSDRAPRRGPHGIGRTGGAGIAAAS